MSLEKELEEAQRIYKDILLGYSKLEIDDGEDIYIKHLSDSDHGWMKEYKSKIYEDAKDRGVFTESGKLESLEEQGLWDGKKNIELDQLRETLSKLIETKSKLIIKKQIKQVDTQIEKNQNRVAELELEKEGLMGVTCESFASKKVNERYLFHTLYKDAELTEASFGEEEFEEMEERVLTSLIVLINEKI